MSDSIDNSEEMGHLPFDDGSTGRLIRRQWHNSAWHFSVIDVIAILTDSRTPRLYWADMKRRIQDEGFIELLAKCHQLKMLSSDGKRYKTDAATAETLLRIVQSVPSPKAEPVKQWLAREGARRLEEVAVNYEQKRLLLRGDIADRNRTLADAAAGAGVLSQRDFGVFQDFGYKGLYGGETAKDIAARKGLAKGEKILDWMEPEELADNIFRAAQTESKLKREATDNKADANRAHFDMGKAIRGFIMEQGGTLPEHLPTPEQSIQELERQEQERVKARLQPTLFPPDAPDFREVNARCKPHYFPPRKRWVNVAMKHISISRPITASIAAMADCGSPG